MPDPQRGSTGAPDGSDESGAFPHQDAMFNNLIARTFSVLPSSPYTPNLPGAPSVPTPAGVLTGTVWDWSGFIYNAKAGNVKIDNAGPADQTPLNAVLTGLPAGGGAVGMPSGTSIVNARIGDLAKNQYRLFGAGRDSSIIKLATATNTNAYEYQAGGNSLVTLAELTFDGNKANQTGGSGLVTFGAQAKGVARDLRVINAYARGIFFYNCTDSLILNCEVENNGKTLTVDGSQSAISVYSQRNRIIGNRSDTSGDHGIHFSFGPQDLSVVVGNLIHNPNGIGIAGGNPPVAGVPQTTRLAIVGNAVDGSILGHGIDLGGAYDVTVTGNVLNSNFGGLTSDTGQRQQWIGNIIRASTGTGANGGIGLFVASSFGGATGYLGINTFAVIGNQFTQGQNWGTAFDSIRGEAVIAANIYKNNGQTANGPLLIASTNQPSGNYLIIGNKAYDDQVVKTQTYGLQINATSYHVYAIHNDFRGNKTGAILDNGTADYTHGNLGYNPRGFLVAPAPAASGVILYNPFNCDCIVYINGTGAAALTAIAIGGVAMPVNAAHVATIGTGTLLHSTSYFYRVSALNPQGETLASVETSIATGAGADTYSVMVRWVAVPGATGYNVYGRTTGAELKIASNVQATTFLDDGSVTPSGALPGADTTGNTALTGVAAAPAANALLVVHVPWGNGIKVTYTTFATANWQWQNAA